jgi:hypothetical protein
MSSYQPPAVRRSLPEEGRQTVAGRGPGADPRAGKILAEEKGVDLQAVQDAMAAARKEAIILGVRPTS